MPINTMFVILLPYNTVMVTITCVLRETTMVFSDSSGIVNDAIPDSPCVVVDGAKFS